MSIQAIAWVLEHSESRRVDRLVLLAIANHADAHGLNAWPSVDQIAREARVGRSTVFECLPRLVKLGELEVTSGGRGRRSTNQYRVVIEGSSSRTLKGPDCGPEGPAPGPSIGSSPRTRRVQTADFRVQTANHEPSLTALEPKSRSLSVVTRGNATGPPPGDRLAEWLTGVGSNTSYDDAYAVVAELRGQGIGDLVIEESIGYALQRGADRPAFVLAVARNWMTQRDPGWTA